MADRTVRVRVSVEAPGAAATTRSVAGGLTAVGEAATGAGRRVRALGVETAAARGGLAAVGASARGGAAAGLAESEAAASRTSRAMNGLRSRVESVLDPVKHLGALLAGGAILFGLHDIVHAGNEYTDAMNKFLEVTRASGGQMEAAGREAQALGADMKLPSANAAEAADAMVELAKAGLSAQDAIKATRGTIQLAAAARTDVATAAKIEGDIMDQFALKSSDAAKVADTLANTSNSASGELMDIYYAMKYVGPIAHTVGVSLEDTATAVGLLGKSGIIGETAGTALRSALVNMAKPTKQVSEGLKTLGIEAFDSNGKFKGLQYVIDALGKANETLSTKQFTAAAAMAFGKPALAAMVALAHQGGTAFEQFGQQVGRAGGAAALAAAESKGLGGAMRGLGKQVSSIFLQVYLGIAPTLEKITRGMTSAVSDAIPYVKSAIRVAGDLWDLYGPTVEAKLRSASSGITQEITSFEGPVKTALTGLAVATVPLAVTSVGALDKTLHNAAAGATPLLSGLHDLFASVSSGAGAFGVLSGRLQVGVSALGDMTAVLKPIGELVGGLAHAFAGLPGPIQLSVISMLAMRPFRSQIQGMQQAVVGFGRDGINAFRGIGDASLYQRVLAAQSGVTLSRFGGIVAELETRSQTFSAMATSFRNVSGSIEQAGGRFAGFRSAAGGAAAALGTGAGRGLLGAAKGLWSFLGGPWGVAIGAAMIGLDLLAKKQQEAAAAAAAHQQRIQSLTQALQQSSGVIDGNVRAAAVQTLADAKLADGKTQLLDVMDKAHVSATELTDAYLGQGTSIDALRKRLTSAAEDNRQWVMLGREAVQVYTPQGKAYMNAANALGSLSGELPDAIKRQKDLAAAVKGGSNASMDATNPTNQLQQAIQTLSSSESDASTKAAALHQALDLLSGGELDVQAAVAQMNAAVLDLNSTWKDGVTKADGYGKGLLQVDGSLNTTSQNGQTLWNKLQALNEQTASAAQATYDYARANGTAVVPALKQAEASMQTAWQAAVTAGQKFGLSADRAKQLAMQMGFIPSSLAITMSTPGLDDTEKQLLYVQGLAGHMPQGATIRVSALTAEAVKDIESVGFKVKTLPGGRQMEITAPTGKAAAALDALITKKLPGKVLGVDADTSSAISGLEAVKAKLAGVPAGKRVTVTAPSASAIAALKSIGLKVTTLPNHQVSVTVPTGGPAAAVRVIQGYINSLHGKTVTNKVITYSKYVSTKQTGPLSSGYVPSNAKGGLIGRYAAGGSVQWIPVGGAVAGPGTDTSDSIPAWLSNNEYVIKAAAVRKYGVAMFDQLNAMRFAKGGAIGAYASGGFTYAPASPADTLGASTGMDRYTAALSKLTDALEKLHSATTKAEKAAAHRAINAADKALGLRAGTTSTAFNLKSYEKFLAQAATANARWESDLAKIGKKAGTDVEDTLRGMGQDGRSLVGALAKASGKTFEDIVANLRKLAPTAKATLADYTNQLKASTSVSKTFQNNLLKLASMGYGDLANQLAAQGDDAAQAIAAAAVKSSGAAASANAAAKASANLLTSDDLANAVTLLGVLRGKSGAGIADVIAAGLDWPTIQALAPKIAAQIKAVTGSAHFVQQLRGQGVAMARGGILTHPTTVLAGEAGVPEAYIPFNGSARSRALLATAAAAFGAHVVPASRYASSSSAPAHQCQGGDRINNITLNGAKQTGAEQAADIARHIAFVG